MLVGIKQSFFHVVDSVKESFNKVGFRFQKKIRFPINDISAEETGRYVRIAALSTAIHTSNPLWLEGTGLRFMWAEDTPVEPIKGMQTKRYSFFNPKTGLKMAMARDENNPNAYMVAFGAVHSLDELVKDGSASRIVFRQRFSLVKSIFGVQPKIYREALKQFENMQRAFPEAQFCLTGQSLGGSLASYVSLKTHTPSVCFNAAALGTGVQYAIGNRTLKNADRYVTHISVESDIASAPHPAIRKADRIINRLRIKTPGIFGVRKRIPNAYDKMYHTHCFPLGSMMQYLGYDKKAKPAAFLNA